MQRSHFVDIQKEYLEFDYKLFKRYRTGGSSWPLQEVIADVFNQFLDERETLNEWSQSFNRPTDIVTLDPRKQEPLVNYAVNQCLAVTRVAFLINKDIVSVYLSFILTIVFHTSLVELFLASA